MIRASSGPTRCCFTCAIIMITFGLMFGAMGIVYLAVDIIRGLGIGFLVFGVVSLCMGVSMCIYAKRAAESQFRERAATNPQGPVVCGLLPGQPVAGNYMEQRPPQNQGGFSQPGSYPPQQQGSHRGYPGNYPPQSGAAGFSHITPSAPPPAHVMGSPPSYSEAVYGPAGKSGDSSHI